MTALASAYDNIRLTRRKVNIAQEEIARHAPGPRRDQAVMRVVSLTEDLVRAVQDFADLGFEEEIASILVHPTEVNRQAAYGAY